jgi:AAA+ superfamily predicted ATPase
MVFSCNETGSHSKEYNMPDETNTFLEETRVRFLDAIDRSERGKHSIKIKTLLGQFGFIASQRVRQASLLAVLQLLDEWGIEYRYSGSTANEYITLSRRLTPPSVSTVEFAKPKESIISHFDGLAPLPFLFQFGDTIDDERSRSIVTDVMNAIWSFRPVLLFVEAEDEFFSFLCGYLSAVLRRRSLTKLHSKYNEIFYENPSVIGPEVLKQYLEQRNVGDNNDGFPRNGAVYVLRDVVDDFEDDDIVALAHERFVPHTYRISAKYKTTSGDALQGKRAIDSQDVGRMFQWILTMSGTREHAPLIPEHVDSSSLLAEAMEQYDSLLERQAFVPQHSSMRSGYESSEHILLKSMTLQGLPVAFPGQKIAVEEFFVRDQNDEENNEFQEDRGRKDKPDIRVENDVWIEIETLRGITKTGSNPFVHLEAKLRQKVPSMKAMKGVWLIVPIDVALMATEQLGGVTRNINALLGESKLQVGFIDLRTATPVFLDCESIPEVSTVKLSGISWRIRRASPTKTLSWSDVAGYSDLKRRLKEDLLDPLLNPERYAEFGLNTASGLLLYGLPGCGKSLIGRVLAGEAGLACKYLQPSDLTSMWVGEGVGKIRSLFDWALKQGSCLIVLDEFDAIAQQRSQLNMIADEKRQVNELLAQLDKIAGRGVLVVATTNYVRGIDSAIQRSGRFDIKLPVFPPNISDRKEIFSYYLNPTCLKPLPLAHDVSIDELAEESVLFTPADIKAVVQSARRKAVHDAENETPKLKRELLIERIHSHPRSIRKEMATMWIEETAAELGAFDKQLQWLIDEVERALGKPASNG